MSGLLNVSAREMNIIAEPLQSCYVMYILILRKPVKLCNQTYSEIVSTFRVDHYVGCPPDGNRTF